MMHVLSNGERMSIHLELVHWSSEEKGLPATSLTSPIERQYASGSSSTSLPVWESEKFCEFPQELVFRVNRGLPTHIEQVNLLSHPFKVASRIEIFTSSSTSDRLHNGRTGVRFERLGFVCFNSNEAMQFTACEIQEVQLPRPVSKVTLLRLVLHTCHQTRANLFSQVGLASVVALGSQTPASVVLPMLSSPLKSPSKEFRNHFSSSTPTSGKATPYWTLSDAAHGAVIKSPRSTNIWIQDTQEYKTPEQICTEIQINKQLAQFAGDEKLVQPWVFLEQEGDRLMNKLELITLTIQPVTAKNLGPASSSRLQRKNEVYGLDDLVKNFADLESQRKHQEEILWRQMSSSPRSLPTLGRENSHISPRDILNRLRSDTWQEREDLLWQLTESLLPSTTTGTRVGNPPARQLSATDADTLEIVTIALGDLHNQVFIATCALLRILLASLLHFQDGVASKSDIANFVERLLNRLGDRDAAVRNAAALTILKIAGAARTRSTFVTHLLLKHVECKTFQPSDQQLLALLKLLAALLLSFHCCANIDIAPKRVLGFLLRSNTDQHENVLVREAAKDLVLVLCADVDEEFVVEHFVRRLPQEQQRWYAQILRQRDQVTVPTHGIPGLPDR